MSRYGPDVDVLEPEELRLAVRDPGHAPAQGAGKKEREARWLPFP